MFCVQENEHMDPFSKEEDPLKQSDSSDDEPSAKRMKTFTPSLNLKVYQIPNYNTPSSLSISLSSPSNLPQFVNNPLNLANPLNISLETNNVVKNLQSRYSLPAKLTITPVPIKNTFASKACGNGEIVRYKKNGEVAKKRGPPKGYKRKPKEQSQSLSNGAILQTQNAILTSLLATNNTSLTVATPPMQVQPAPAMSVTSVVNTVVSPVTPQIKLPEGTELVELLLDPEDWFPAEPYKMVFSRKKNPKWKNFPYRCEHCFKGYRVVSTLLQHAAERHGSVPKDLAIPCPCCPHVSTRRKHHKKHLETHEGRKHRIFCQYCLPTPEVTEEYVKESQKFPFDKYPQYWYASEESLRLHKKRKHPYAAMFNYSWFCTWGESIANS